MAPLAASSPLLHRLNNGTILVGVPRYHVTNDDASLRMISAPARQAEDHDRSCDHHPLCCQAVCVHKMQLLRPYLATETYGFNTVPLCDTVLLPYHSAVRFYQCTPLQYGSTTVPLCSTVLLLFHSAICVGSLRCMPSGRLLAVQFVVDTVNS
jgi:hypothetical protein